jgi:hypothetical protein
MGGRRADLFGRGRHQARFFPRPDRLLARRCKGEGISSVFQHLIGEGDIIALHGFCVNQS